MSTVTAFDFLGRGIDMSATNNGTLFISSQDFASVTFLGQISADTFSFQINDPGIVKFFTVTVSFFNPITFDIVIKDLAYFDININPLITWDNANIAANLFDDFSAGAFLIALQGSDAIHGNNFADIIKGAAGDDFIFGNGGNDSLFGESGDDVLNGGVGADALNGGLGSDTASYQFALSRVDARLISGRGFAGEANGDTFVSIENLFGSAFNDTLVGNNGTNVILADDGNDIVVGLGGNDVLDGQGGNDTLQGGAGADLLDGGAGIDAASYGGATSRVDVRLINNAGFDGEAIGDTFSSIENLVGTAFDDVLGGDNGVNALAGGGGNDILNAFGASDILNGGAGNDLLIGGAGGDRLIGSTGIDTASYQNAGSRVTVRLDLAVGALSDATGDTYSSIENATGSNFNDILVGSSGANALRGGAGNDLLLGGAGADAQNGGTGTDTVSYQNAPGRVAVRLDLGLGFLSHAAGDSYAAVENLTGSPFNDTLVGNGSVNALAGGAGNDLLIGGAAADALNGGSGTDTASYQNAGSRVAIRLDLGSGFLSDATGDSYVAVENLTGSNFNDLLVGDGGTNVLIGGSGNDLLIGGPAADTLNGGSGTDVASYQNATDRVAIRLDLGRGFLSDAAGDRFAAVENLTGSNFDDVLVGDGAANGLVGGAGNDLLIGGAAGDGLNGGAGNDTASYQNASAGVAARLNTGTGLLGDAAGDRFSGIENLMGSNFNDTLLGNFFSNELTGRAGNDTLIGGGGDDLLVGGTGADAMNGGTGADTASYAGAAAGVTARLNVGNGIAGEAAGDTFTDIENLTGSAFDDTLFGNGVANTLTGGTGDDMLAGGAGNDLFVFDTGDGNDTIIGFAGGAGAGDVIFFNNGADLPDNFAQVQAAAAQDGLNTVITFGSDSITLLNFNVGNLNADDFMF